MNDADKLSNIILCLNRASMMLLDFETFVAPYYCRAVISFLSMVCIPI